MPFAGAGTASATGVADPEGAKLACRFAIDGRPPSSSASAQSIGCAGVPCGVNDHYDLKHTVSLGECLTYIVFHR